MVYRSALSKWRSNLAHTHFVTYQSETKLLLTLQQESDPQSLPILESETWIQPDRRDILESGTQRFVFHLVPSLKRFLATRSAHLKRGKNTIAGEFESHPTSTGAY